jgi:hypothetical protein
VTVNPKHTARRIDPVLEQYLAILLLKAASAMVLSLRLHVLQHGFQLTRLSDCGMAPMMILLVREVNRAFSA